MKEPTFAAAYAAFYPMLAEIARGHGYALAIHGSLVSDFDLIAIPWTKEAVGEVELIDSIAEYAGIFNKNDRRAVIGPEQKEHSRMAWTLMLGNGAVLDFSVMPKLITPNVD